LTISIGKIDFFSLYVALERSNNCSNFWSVVTFFDNWSNCVDHLSFLSTSFFQAITLRAVDPDWDPSLIDHNFFQNNFSPKWNRCHPCSLDDSNSATPVCSHQRSPKEYIYSDWSPVSPGKWFDFFCCYILVWSSAHCHILYLT
jgi:hypothetical protein